MSYIIVARERSDSGWRPYQCANGRVTFDAYEACYRARKLAQMGYREVEVHPVGEEGVFCRFTASETGAVQQEGGLEL